ncbi:MAG: YicC family protein [Gammaproteobacteria bacterium]|nr:YicC family protein [Gammaproteobacteria bacterium]
MTQSMTAFSRCELDTELGSLTCEIRSVNNRFLDLQLRLPEELRTQEAALRQQVSIRINRGKVDCSIRFRPSAGAAGLPTINRDLLKGLVALTEQVSAELTNAAPTSPLELLRWPGVTAETKLDMEPLVEHAKALLSDGLDQLIQGRLSEGGRLKLMLLERCEGIAEKVADVRANLPEVHEAIRSRITEKLEKISQEIDQDRLEQELVFLAQKMDVAEELDRLESHLAEMSQVLDSNEPVGRRLDFLIQEFNREANTLSSKSQDIRTTQCAVDIKVLVEQMREQAQNIE